MAAVLVIVGVQEIEVAGMGVTSMCKLFQILKVNENQNMTVWKFRWEVHWCR